MFSPVNIPDTGNYFFYKENVFCGRLAQSVECSQKVLGSIPAHCPLNILVA